MTLLETYTDFHRGSEWRKWDLHIHTKGTMKEDRFKATIFEEFCIDMFKRALANDIAVIGVTDYFSIENYKKVKEIQKIIINSEELENNIENPFTNKEKGKIRKILLIPNMEMRLRTQAQRSLINIHCLFNPDFINNNFDNYFLSEIKYSEENLTRQGLINLGKRREEKSELITDDAAYKKGIEKFTIDYEDFKDVFQRNEVRENCITIIADGSNDGNSGLKEFPDLRMEHLKTFDALFTSTPSSINFYLGKGKRTEEEITAEYGSLKACFHGSDAHTEDDLFQPALDRYCWIKADPTFEGLKQVIHEPENRVKIQELSPDNKANHNIIDRIEIDNESIANKAIYFNPDLNVIIGGRSSGKSALLAGLAHHLGCSNEISNDDYKSYIQNDFSKGFSLYFKGSDKAYQKDENAQERIEYFPQNRFSELAKDQDAFDALVKSIVKDEPIYDHVEKYNEEISNLSTQIREALEKCWRLNSEIVDIQDSLNKKPSTEDLEKQEKEFNTKYSKLNAEPISDEERKLYEAKTTTKDDLIKHLKQIESYSRLSESLQQEPIIDISALKEKINRTDFHKLEIKEFLDKELSELESNFKEGWKKVLNDFEEKREEAISETKNHISDIDTNNEYQSIKERLSTNSEAEKIIKEIGNIKKKVSEIKEEEESLKNKQNFLKSEQRKVIQSFYKFSSKTKDLVEKISLTPGSPTGQDSLKITTKMAYNYNQYIQDLVIDKCDQRKLNSRINCEIENELSNDKIHKKIKDIIKVLLRKPDVLRSSVGLQDFLYSILTRSWFSFNYNVEYEGDSFHEMSEGKKSFVILKLILEFSDKKVPLLIDQPEDDLDNRAIFTELVAYLKTKKLDRQIILVTHNANIVVNADSELVIVANQHGNNSPNTDEKQFEYVQGSIEHSFPEKDEESRVLHSQGIREHICEIMEGGIEAFKRREKRYNI